METLESALALLIENAIPVRETERVPLLGALGRVCAREVASPIDVPPFDRSPLDGYALHSADVALASRENPAVLTVIGEACAGCGERFAVARGQALRIMTGAPVPPECDCVIRQEDTDEGMETVRVYAPVGAGKNICRAGEDVPRGAAMAQPGEVITCAHIGVFASLGVTELEVYRRVRVALLATGDELAQPGEMLAFGQIYDSNRAVLTARLAELGVQANVLPSCADEPQAVADALIRAAREADVLITTGGVSVGKKDIMHRVLPLMGAHRLFWKVAMKPGSPLLCAQHGGRPVICLSGNPFAALACFEVFAVPVLRRLGGWADWQMRRVRARLCGGFGKASPGRRLIRARVEGGCAYLTGSNHSSGSLAEMIGCNCLIDIPAGSGPLGDGDDVEVLLL
ncbi:MAG: molybdopterin molybdotransferase MoeA [Treponema sp.]|nr:molybdopterin molybdotransferase MoeA [Treponema sp.]